MEKRKLRSRRAGAGFVLVLAIAGLAASAATARPISLSGIVVAPDTTVFTGPLRADGTVDYPAALNALTSQGVTPQNNAAALLIRIHWASPFLNQPIDRQRRQKIRRLLGISEALDDEVIWQEWLGFANPIPTDNLQNPDHVDRFATATTKPWSSEQLPEVAAWLTSNAPAVRIGEQASLRPRFWLPVVIGPLDKGLHSIRDSESSEWHGLRDALCLRSMLKLQGRDPAGALDDLLTAARLGSLMEQSSDLMMTVVGSSFIDAACRNAERVMQASNFPPPRLRQWSEDMLRLPTTPVVPPTVLLRERCHFLVMIHHYAELEDLQLLQHMSPDELLAARAATAGETPVAGSAGAAGAAPAVMDWNRAMRLGNHIFDQLAKDRSAEPAPQRLAELQALGRRIEQLDAICSQNDVFNAGDPPKWLWSHADEGRDAYSDRVGTIVLMTSMPSVLSIGRAFRIIDERLQWTARVGVALAIYRQDHQAYPPALEAVLPGYLPKLPASLTDAPIVYQRRGNGYIIRHAVTYTGSTKRYMEQHGMEFDPHDIVIRTDE